MMVVGGTTYSRDVSETNDQCVDGCALIATYDKWNDRYIMRYVYKNMRGVLDMSSSDIRDTTFILFRRMDERSA